MTPGGVGKATAARVVARSFLHPECGHGQGVRVGHGLVGELAP